MRSTTSSSREISPELVLVDPELRSVERLRLAERTLVPEGDSRSPAWGQRREREMFDGAAMFSSQAANDAKPADRPEIATRGRTSPRGRRLLLSVAAASLTVNAVIAVGSLRQSRSAAAVFNSSADRTRPATTASSPPGPRAVAVPAEPRSLHQRTAVSERPPKLAVATPHVRTPRRTSTATQRKRATSNTPRLPRETGLARKSPTTATQSRHAVAIRMTGIARATLSWHAVKGASYYNVVIWRGHRRVLDLWPSTNRVLVPRTWSRRGARGSLSAGRYLWFAYPGMGSRASGRYGTQVQSGTLIVTDKKVSQ
jgi:hypothetical protein